MRITVMGATGMIGSRVSAEAAARGHRVVAVSRRGTAVTGAERAVAADITNQSQVDELCADADVVVGATRPDSGREDTVTSTTSAVLDAASRAGVRVVFVGGAGPLRSPREDGLLVVDDPDYVGAAWRRLARASVTQLRLCREHSADWTYLSPPAMIAPGDRSGRYRRGTTELLVTHDGTSRISAEDFAVALVDELENPSGQRHLTVGY